METREKHESYGIIDVCKFSGNGSQFFGSDLIHNNGISITISTGEVVRKLSHEWYHADEELIRIELSANQFVDAITSGMNTSGVPCTIKRFNGKGTERVDFVKNKKEEFTSEMKETQQEFLEKITNITDKLSDGKMGKKKLDEILFDLKVLKSHISSNTNFVLKSFNESMEKTVTEAKHSISNYIDNKIHKLGIESMRNELQIGIETGSSNQLEKRREVK